MFKRTSLLTIAAAVTISLTAGAAQASTKTFYKPKFNGNRLDLCLNWSVGCGKPAANAYCKLKGFKKATKFYVDHNIGLSQPTRLISTGAVCDQGYCDGFKAIKCYKANFVPLPNPKFVKFYKPRWGSDRLDLCMNWGVGCGKPAAAKFCHSKGFAKLHSFKIAHNIGHVQRTRLIGTGAVCDQGFCDGFKVITCKKL